MITYRVQQYCSNILNNIQFIVFSLLLFISPYWPADVVIWLTWWHWSCDDTDHMIHSHTYQFACSASVSLWTIWKVVMMLFSSKQESTRLLDFVSWSITTALSNKEASWSWTMVGSVSICSMPALLHKGWCKNTITNAYHSWFSLAVL